tara:strand:- start:290 stop:748 length:459 start_codon:yes stop_codon:yes gene_type:complete
MPNWCQNRVSFYSENEEQLGKLKTIFESDEPFNTIVPSPDWKTTPNDKGELPVLREMKSPRTGEVFHRTYDFPDGTNDDRWYSWNVANWGTKWEVADVECDHFDECSFECEFETAWSPPEGIFYALRDLFPDVDVSWFYDEPGMQFAGYLGQ